MLGGLVVSDARVLVNSSIFVKASNGVLLPSTTRRIAGTNIPLFIIGDSAYSLSFWLMKPYPESTSDPARKTYNYRISCARIVVENAFG